MATLTLRPTSNVSVQHTASSGSAYSCISEATADNDSTYIYTTIQDTSTSRVSSSFVFGVSISGKRYKVSSGAINIVAKNTSSASSGNTSDVAQISATVDVNGVSFSSSNLSLTTAYSNRSVTLSTEIISEISKALESGTVPSVTITLTTRGYKGSSKNTDYQIRVTQAYVSLEVTEIATPTTDGTGLWIKVNGKYQKVYRVLKRIEGKYVEQADLKSIFTDGSLYIFK